MSGVANVAVNAEAAVPATENQAVTVVVDQVQVAITALVVARAVVVRAAVARVEVGQVVVARGAVIVRVVQERDNNYGRRKIS